MTQAKPLLIHIAPADGEYLLSWIMRAAQAHVLPATSTILQLCGMNANHLRFIPYTAHWDREPLSRLLDVSLAELEAHTHLKWPNRAGFIDWWGTPLLRRLHSGTRRVAVQTVKNIGYVRADWMVKPVSFCPITLEKLVAVCDACGEALGWKKPVDPWRCDNCEHQLRPASFNAPISHSAQIAAGLISSDASTRAVSLSTLPEPFAKWEAGDVFEAILELGLCAQDFAKGETRDWRQLLTCFDPDESPDVISAGYSLLLRWPESLGDLIQRHVSSDNLAGEGLIRPFVGLLRCGSSRTPFRQLLRTELPAAISKLPVPFKVMKRSPLYAERSASVITADGARRQLQISRLNLANLIPDGDCLLSYSYEGRGMYLFDKRRLEQSVFAYKSALRPLNAQCALGVPTFVIPELVKSGLVNAVADRDAVRLSAQPYLVENSSLQLLLGRLARFTTSANAGVPLVQALGAHRFDPKAWVAVLSKAVDCGSAVTGRRESEQGPIDELLFDQTVIASLLGTETFRTGSDEILSISDCAILLDAPEHAIFYAIKGGLLPATRLTNHSRVRLADLEDFHRKFLTRAEMFRLFGFPQSYKFDFPGKISVEGGGSTYWPRTDLLAALAADSPTMNSQAA